MKIFPFNDEISSSTMANIMIRNAEGYQLYPYKDIFGNFTVGYGFLMNTFTHLKSKDIYKYGLSEQDSEAILVQKITKIMGDMDITYSHLTQNVYYIFIDMIYNLGFEQFKSFKTFISFCEQNEIEKAVNDLTNTLWYQQVRQRAIRDCLNLLSKKFYYLM